MLDCLSKSGCLAFDHASLHIIMASTHCFDKTLLDTVVKDNVNPIEKVERSTLIVATTIHGKLSEELINSSMINQVKTYSPLLFQEENAIDDKAYLQIDQILENQHDLQHENVLQSNRLI